ncbi:alkene reductase [Nocardia sp. alder85J]|uniref:alkene reductase n=1 Tax=Nocardia sp. alder85J TaxID=2862949 RepID=UPI001CD7A6C3|nr:alkene reductase [Nocardia sp. alder85J]MCX4096673.1 alkene reductase [Nocardia sp. alder85J]
MHLFDPYQLGPLSLPHRVVMAPMTRNRAVGTIPGPMNAEYYAQRASAALIITEGIQPSAMGQGYPKTPDLHTPEHVAGWARVTDAVHRNGGRIIAQLMHAGRISHPHTLPAGALPVGPSAVRPAGRIFTTNGLENFVTPRERTTAEVSGIVDEFAHAAEQAKEAEFDGIEIHAANGYLLDQFLQTGTNQRTDSYGGSAPARSRLLLQATATAVTVWGPGRVGVRVAPGGTFNDMRDDNPIETFGHVGAALNDHELAYIHVVETSQAERPRGMGDTGPTALLRSVYRGTIISAGEYTRDTAEAALAAGKADLIAFGRSFLANPDLPERLRRNITPNEPDPTTFYGGGAAGYTDYPTSADASVKTVLSRIP